VGLAFDAEKKRKKIQEKKKEAGLEEGKKARKRKCRKEQEHSIPQAYKRVTPRKGMDRDLQTTKHSRASQTSNTNLNHNGEGKEEAVDGYAVEMRGGNKKGGVPVGEKALGSRYREKKNERTANGRSLAPEGGRGIR